MVTKHVEYSDDHEILSWYESDTGLIIPITKGGIRRLPYEIWKVPAMALLYFLIWVAISTAVAWYMYGWDSVMQFYSELWYHVKTIVSAFWNLIVGIWNMLLKIERAHGMRH